MFEMLCKFETQNQHVHQIEKTGRRTWQQIEAQTFGSHQAKAFPRDLTEDCAPQRVHVSHFPENQIQFCTFFSYNLLAIQTKYRVQFSTNRFGAIILPSFILAEHITNQVWLVCVLTPVFHDICYFFLEPYIYQMQSCG